LRENDFGIHVTRRAHDVDPSTSPAGVLYLRGQVRCAFRPLNVGAMKSFHCRLFRADW